MVPVHAVIPGALAQVLRKAPLTQEKVAFAWRQAVGQTLDRVTMVELRDTVLVVRARDNQWKREVERAIPVVRPRLDAVLGPEIVRWIEVTVASS
jgi:hypothetical protein